MVNRNGERGNGESDERESCRDCIYATTTAYGKCCTLLNLAYASTTSVAVSRVSQFGVSCIARRGLDFYCIRGLIAMYILQEGQYQYLFTAQRCTMISSDGY